MATNDRELIVNLIGEGYTERGATIQINIYGYVNDFLKRLNEDMALILQIRPEIKEVQFILEGFTITKTIQQALTELQLAEQNARNKNPFPGN